MINECISSAFLRSEEFAPCWLKKRPRRLRDAPFPERLELTVNGCGLAGIYRRQDGHTATYHCDKASFVHARV